MTRLSVLAGLLLIVVIGSIAQGCTASSSDGLFGPRAVPAGATSTFPTAIILGSFPESVQQAAADLAAAGLTVIEPARVEKAFAQQHFRPAHTSGEQVDPIKVGRSLGADLIVFLEVVSGRRPTTCEEPPCQIIYAPFVSARAFSTETGHILWSGRAHSTTSEARLTAAIMDLTHEAIHQGLGDWSARSARTR